MKKIAVLFAFAFPLLAQQDFDFSSLDKLGANSTGKTNITLDSDMLKLGANFLGSSGDGASLKKLVDNLKGVYIRSFAFDKYGQYNEADLDPLRAYLKQQQWTRIIESREKQEVSEIYIRQLPNNQFGGVAILSAEPKEVTVVYINGVLNPGDLEKLGGNMGVPDLSFMKDRKKAADKADKKKKEDEE